MMDKSPHNRVLNRLFTFCGALQVQSIVYRVFKWHPALNYHVRLKSTRELASSRNLQKRVCGIYCVIDLMSSET